MLDSSNGSSNGDCAENAQPVLRPTSTMDLLAAKHAIEHRYDRLHTPRACREARWRGVLAKIETIDDQEQRESVLRHHRRLETANLRAKRRPLRRPSWRALAR